VATARLRVRRDWAWPRPRASLGCHFGPPGPDSSEDGLTKHCPNPECAGLARDGVVAEYEDAIVECLDCGARLVLGPPGAAPEAALEFRELATVYLAPDPISGQALASALEAQGVPVYLKGAMLVGAVGELPANVQQVEVQVPEERREHALEIVEDFERGVLDLDRGPWDPEI